MKTVLPRSLSKRVAFRISTDGWRDDALGGPSGCVGVRRVHDYIRGTAPGGTFKLPLTNKSIVGVAQSRGARMYQEDRTKAVALQLDPVEVQRNLKERLRTEWDPSQAGSSFMAAQTAYFGIFDGHGGEHVSKYISEHLHELFETVDPASIPEIIRYTKSHGDYFNRWRGGGLRRWMPDSVEGVPAEGSGMTFEERLVLAFLTADKQVLETIEESPRCGATATVALMHSLDEPAQAYWAADKLNLTIAHLGDTKAILHQTNGECLTLTENHHANSRIESARLLRMGNKNVVMDSYGESRWMGAVENTRSIGDGEYKPSGVTAEPEIRSQVLNGDDFACLVLVTDGLTSLISNQEICDLTRGAKDPTKAAQAILKFAEDLDPQDNCTCMVIPLKGWGKVKGEDMTRDRREYRRRQASTTALKTMIRGAVQGLGHPVAIV